jgi:hypothetical protein
MQKGQLQIMLSDVGSSNFERLIVFCIEKEREDRALRRKMLIESRKCILEDYNNQLDELLCS